MQLHYEERNTPYSPNVVEGMFSEVREFSENSETHRLGGYGIASLYRWQNHLASSLRRAQLPALGLQVLY